jgi:hypothetical protein
MTSPVARYALVPKAVPAEANGGIRVRRFSLARVRVSPRSELGFDRHERLEEVAWHENGKHRGEAGPSAESDGGRR